MVNQFRNRESSLDIVTSSSSLLQVMTHGPSVKIPCVQDTPGAAPQFKFPAEWGGSLMQCRDPHPCLADFPVPPIHSGLVVRVA